MTSKPRSTAHSMVSKHTRGCCCCLRQLAPLRPLCSSAAFSICRRESSVARAGDLDFRSMEIGRKDTQVNRWIGERLTVESAVGLAFPKPEEREAVSLSAARNCDGYICPETRGVVVRGDGTQVTAVRTRWIGSAEYGGARCIRRRGPRCLETVGRAGSSG